MYCSNCGSQVPPGASACEVCGNQVTPTGSPQEPVVSHGTAVGPGGAHTGDAAAGEWVPRAGHAGFWKRFAAVIIDGIIVNILGFMAGTLFTLGGGSADDARPDQPIWFLLSMVPAWLYYSLMESSQNQATLGKQALGIIVVDTDGRRITFARASGRYFAKILSVLTLLVGYLMAAFTRRKQALHDMVAGTLVVNKPRA